MRARSSDGRVDLAPNPPYRNRRGHVKKAIGCLILAGALLLDAAGRDGRSSSLDQFTNFEEARVELSRLSEEYYDGEKLTADVVRGQINPTLREATSLLNIQLSDKVTELNNKSAGKYEVKYGDQTAKYTIASIINSAGYQQNSIDFSHKIGDNTLFQTHLDVSQISDGSSKITYSSFDDNAQGSIAFTTLELKPHYLEMTEGTIERGTYGKTSVKNSSSISFSRHGFGPEVTQTGIGLYEVMVAMNTVDQFVESTYVDARPEFRVG